MRVLVAVIAYNESSSIEAVIEDLKTHAAAYDIIVVDNGSTDDMAAKVENKKVRCIQHCANTDINGAWLTYFTYAYRNDYDIVCQFDGDGQHLAEELPKILRPIFDGEANEVIGSRFLTRDTFRSSFVRRIGIRAFSLLLSGILGYRIHDVTSGFIAFDRSLIEFFGHYYKHEINDPNQTHLLSHLSGARIMEVPVRMRPRTAGKSLYGLINSILYPIKGLINIVGCLLYRNQIQREWRKKS